MRTFLDEEGRKRYKEFKVIIRRDQDPDDEFKLTAFVDQPEPCGVDRSIFLHQMNNYELVALGIHTGMFDEKFYKLWFHRQFTTDYESVEPFIVAVQQRKKSRFCEFQKLYRSWKKNLHPIDQPSRFAVAWWGLTKDYDKLSRVSGPGFSSTVAKPVRGA